MARVQDDPVQILRVLQRRTWGPNLRAQGRRVSRRHVSRSRRRVCARVRAWLCAPLCARARLCAPGCARPAVPPGCARACLDACAPVRVSALARVRACAVRVYVCACAEGCARISRELQERMQRARAVEPPPGATAAAGKPPTIRPSANWAAHLASPAPTPSAPSQSAAATATPPSTAAASGAARRARAGRVGRGRGRATMKAARTVQSCERAVQRAPMSRVSTWQVAHDTCSRRLGAVHGASFALSGFSNDRRIRGAMRAERAAHIDVSTGSLQRRRRLPGLRQLARGLAHFQGRLPIEIRRVRVRQPVA